MWKVNYSYDGQYIGDLFEITSGFNQNLARNSVGQITFSVSLRKLASWCTEKNFDITRMFTPIKSTVKTVHPDGVNQMGGWLSKTPTFTFGSSADATVQFTFVSWLGLTAGAFLIPPLSYNDNFDDVAAEQITLVVERTAIAGAMWPITVGEGDVLPVVSGTLEAPKTLKDFLLERADNTEGTGSFDVYADPSGVITLYGHYGTDISSTTTLTYPATDAKYGLKEIVFPEWDNYISDVFLTGAGNGYASTSGAEGAAIFTEAQNTLTIANTGYWQTATSESDIADQTTLDAKATSYVKNTDKPFAVPTLKLDGDQYKLYAHELGGDLWLGDTLNVDTSAWVESLLPIETPLLLRINSVDMAVDRTGHCELSLGMVSDV